jgi:3-isopropylmalate dehydrogenase
MTCPHGDIIAPHIPDRSPFNPQEMQSGVAMNATITLLPGDGIGPEVAAKGRDVLEAVAAQFGYSFTFREELVGDIAIDETGDPSPNSALPNEPAKKAI